MTIIWAASQYRDPRGIRRAGHSQSFISVISVAEVAEKKLMAAIRP
jgi:hypothetical protein